MTNRPAEYSLRKRLAVWLALQTFVGLALVAIAVYCVIALQLAARQTDILEEKRVAVTHVVHEAQRTDDYSALSERLYDYFAGHREFGVALLGPDQTSLYESRLRLRETTARLMEFFVPASSGRVAPVHVKLWLDTHPDDQLLKRLAVALAAIALIGASAVSLGGLLLVQRALAPIRTLIEQTRRIAADTLAERLDTAEQPSEVRELVIQFNALLARVQAAYDQLDAFNADVAHELNTPLATLMTSNELALRKLHEPQDVRELLGSNLEELQRMSGMIQDMLFLTHADRGAQARRSQVNSLASVAADVVEYHDATLSEAQLRADIVGDAAGYFDVPLLKRALSNLVGNATRYGAGSDAIQIEIAHTASDRVRVVVSNRGEPIGDAHLPRLFDRFYRVDAARGQSEQRHGLGLAIVAAVARMHGGTVFAISQDYWTRIGMELPIDAPTAHRTI